MADKINLSLDDIIAKSGLKLDTTKKFNQRIVKKDLSKEDLTKVVVRLENDTKSGNQITNKRKVEEVLNETTVDKSGGEGSHFSNSCGLIFVENLKCEVTDDDIQQLFGAFGTLKRAAINYQKDGGSAGTALIVFERKSDAESAFTSLQNITLDGRVLKLTLIDSCNSSFARNANDFNSRIKRQAKESFGTTRQMWSEMAANFDSAPTERRGFTKYRSKKDDNEKEVINAEDLDADLESYLAQRKKE